MIHKSNLVPSDPVIRKVDYMGKDLKGKELGVGLFQRQDKRYSARFTNRYGRRMQFYDEKLSVVSRIKYNIEPAFPMPPAVYKCVFIDMAEDFISGQNDLQALRCVFCICFDFQPCVCQRFVHFCKQCGNLPCFRL